MFLSFELPSKTGNLQCDGTKLAVIGSLYLTPCPNDLSLYDHAALVSQSFLDVGVVHHLSSTAGAGHTVPANPMLQRINVLDVCV